MKKYILTLFGLLTILCLSAQVTITTSPTHDKYQVVEGGYRTEVPLGSTYIDVNSSSQVAIKTIGTDKILVNYKTPSTYTINGSNYTNLDSCVKYLALATSLQLEYLISNISGGGGGSVTASNGIQIMGDSSVGLGGTIKEETYIKPTIDYPLNIYNEDYDVGFMHNGNGVEMRGVNANLLMGDDVVLIAPKSTLANSEYVVMVDSLTPSTSKQLRLVPKSEFSGGGGAYLPLDIQDSTTVELNGNSVMFKGDNHSLAMNTPFEALEIAEAVMDGFRAKQYDDILTMNGLMKVPLGFGDTIRYPVMFVSHGMPFSDTARFASIRGSLGNELGFIISTSDEVAEDYVTYGFFNDKFNIIKNAQSVFEVDLATGDITADGDITATGEIKGTSYITKTSPNSYAQMQDVTDLTSPNIITVFDSIYYIEPNISSIVTLVEGAEDVYLPDVLLSIGNSIYIVNNNVNGVNINSFTANDDIWDSGSKVSSIIIPSYSTTKLISNGNYWAIFKN